MKAKIEDIPFENRGVEITSETDEERVFLESLWTKSPAAAMLTRNDNGSVTITFGPSKSLPKGVPGSSEEP